MLFLKRFWEPIRNGEVTMTFRRWKAPQVLAGGRYRTAVGFIRVETVDTIDEGDITDEEARLAGHKDAPSLVRDLPLRPGLPLYRIVFHVVDEPDPRAELADSDNLAPEDIAEIGQRLARLDRASSHGAWTHRVLEVISANPGRRAPDLAAMFERETQPFKTDVRKLKNLGLTISLRIGYRLSPRGAAYLNAISGSQPIA